MSNGGVAPTWLAPNHPRAIVVDADALVRKARRDAASPTFNSHALYLALPHIQGISDVFLQLDDDFFVTRPLSRAFFFHRERGGPARPGLRRGWHEVNAARRDLAQNTFSGRAALHCTATARMFILAQCSAIFHEQVVFGRARADLGAQVALMKEHLFSPQERGYYYSGSRGNRYKGFPPGLHVPKKDTGHRPGSYRPESCQ